MHANSSVHPSMSFWAPGQHICFQISSLHYQKHAKTLFSVYCQTIAGETS
ncbi:unnamed protein product [Tenebrio molitor]|nr:unnamed protein product [Tenebrio molitor]